MATHAGTFSSTGLHNLQVFTCVVESSKVLYPVQAIKQTPYEYYSLLSVSICTAPPSWELPLM